MSLLIILWYQGISCHGVDPILTKYPLLSSHVLGLDNTTSLGISSMDLPEYHNFHVLWAWPSMSNGFQLLEWLMVQLSNQSIFYKLCHLHNWWVSSSSGSKFDFQQNTTMEQYQEKIKHFVDIRKHIETLLHLSAVTREAAGLIKLATNGFYSFTPHW